MIRKIAPILALFIGLFTCSLEGQWKCVTPGQFPFGGGVIRPFASSYQYDADLPQAREQQTVDERINGTRDVPVGGAGLMQSWSF
jgi:hypothetical protein